MEEGFALELTIVPVWERIDAIRELVTRIIGLYADEDFQDALSMVCAELLENAVKYGRSDHVIHLAMTAEDRRIVATCTNAVEAGSSHPSALRERVEWLKTFSDPLEAYTRALELVYEHANERDEDSGLGIVRIAYDGGCDVECDLSTRDRVVVIAKSRRRLGSPE